MRKTALTLLAPLCLLANPNYEREHFQQALDSYNHKSFSESYELLQKYSSTNTLDSDSRFMLARCAYEIGRYDEAEKLYIELLEQNSDNNRLKLELAQTYHKQQKIDKAEALYLEVLKDTNLPNSVRANIEGTLALIEKKEPRNFFKTTLGIGYGYDSNVDSITDDDYVYWNGLPLSVQDRRSNHFMEYFANVNHTYKLSDSMTIDNKLTGYKQSYSSAKDKNLDIAILGTGISHYSSRSKISLGFDFNYIKLDSKSYLNNYALTAGLDFKIDNDLLYRAKAKLIRKDFRQSDYNFRDSHYYELSNALTYISQDFGASTIAFTLGSDNKIGQKHHNVDYKFGSLRVSNIYPIMQNGMISSAIEYYGDRYSKSENFLYKNKKRDDKMVYDLSYLHSFTKELSGGISGRYINNHSNQNLYKYDKYTLKTNIYYSF